MGSPERLVVVLAVCGMLACESIAGLQDFTFVEAADASSVDDAGAPDAPIASNGCPTGRGPRMVRVGDLCIDATEVTEAQYAAFLAGDAGTPPAACAWNTSYAPGDAPGTTPLCFPAGAGFPQGCVDFCDATMFCRWAGKALCTATTWARACGDAKAYPYGPTYDPKACNGRDQGGAKLVAAGSLAKCQAAAAPGLFDMSGNAWEWIDQCAASDAGPSPSKDACSIRGGSVTEGPDDLSCAAAMTIPRDFMQYNVGFRCCATAR